MNRLRVYRLSLAWFQIVGGLLGLGISILIPINSPFILLTQYIQFTIGLSLFAYSIICGLALIYNKRYASNLSLINQILQIISFSIMGYGFQYVSGLFVSFGIKLRTGDFLFTAGSSSWNIEWAWDSTNLEIHFNLIAVLLIILIEKIKEVEESYSNDFIEQNSG